MERNMEESLQAMEATLRENMELARRNRRVALWGTGVIVALIVVFGLIIFSKFKAFDVQAMQREVAVKAPPVLAPAIQDFQTDLAETLYPVFMQELSRQMVQEAPRFQQELEKQMVLLFSDLEAEFRERIYDDSTAVVRDVIDRGMADVHLTPVQEKNVHQFVGDSVEYIMTDMQPFIDEQTDRNIAMFTDLYNSFYQLEGTRLGQYLWPRSREEATVSLFKSLLELAVLKLEDPEVREGLEASLETDIILPPMQ